ncbi:MAG: multicopper oxidase domain-containing protein [Methylococcaceae bacterium]|nr:multicopper oxidase domain-containing protein [Methylococcaceae bacterium]MDD1609570.1 multicopper oxidase domain-containing protein [Methylococcaceae bacterium]MDD1615836.1 multicopper oxidase domain-containing protein [Methylococcaceae bacterium]OYV19306.1 MAG: multicopper oxidase type 3 [Methylococcaceae bacterium NSP1-2]
MYKSFALIGLTLTLFGVTESAFAATQNFTLYINAGTLPITGNGGATLNVWGYGTTAVPVVPAPQLTVNEGDTVNITVINNHNINHNFIIKNVTTDTSAIAAGASKNYSFTAPAAGSYVYSDTLDSNVNREMGLYGAMIVKPTDGSQTAWIGGPAYDHENVWVVSEMDKPRWNDIAAAGFVVDTATYKPNYFMINGLGGFDAMMDMDTMIMGTLNTKSLVRIVNAGQFSHSLHFHGNHFQVLSINGVRQPTPFEQWDTINVPPMSTAEVLYSINQTGHYPMHVHTAQAEGANGVYLNGAATMIDMQ